MQFDSEEACCVRLGRVAVKTLVLDSHPSPSVRHARRCAAVLLHWRLCRRHVRYMRYTNNMPSRHGLHATAMTCHLAKRSSQIVYSKTARQVHHSTKQSKPLNGAEPS